MAPDSGVWRLSDSASLETDCSCLGVSDVEKTSSQWEKGEAMSLGPAKDLQLKAPMV